MLKIILLRNLQTLRANNSRTLRIENVKFSGHCFYMNINIYRDFQICISVPLKDSISQCLQLERIFNGRMFINGQNVAEKTRAK